MVEPNGGDTERDTVRLSICIQHHPIRAELAAQMLESLPGAELATDPDPYGMRNPWRGYRNALQTTPPDATHRLIVQDDVIICPGFVDAVHAAIAAKPDRLLSFFVAGNPYEHSQAVYNAANLGLSWAELDNQRWCPVVCLSWPVAHVPAVLAFVDAQNWPDAFRADDEIVGRYCQYADILPLASVPSLVDHPDDVPSLLGNKAMYGEDPGRTTACWIGGCDPATIDWNLGP